MEQIKFRSAHYFHKTQSFSHFSYWGRIDHKGGFSHDCFTSPSSASGSAIQYEEQFIGEEDREGNPIYEGDIVKCFSDGVEMEVPDTITFKDGCFWLSRRNVSLFEWKELSEISGELLVIGNIHETPELGAY